MKAEDEGVEPTDRFRGHGLANHCLSRSAYPPACVLYQLATLERNLDLRYTTSDMDPANDQENPSQSTLQNEPQAVVVRREPERDLVTWIAPARPFKRRDRQFFVTTFAIAGIVGLILFLAEGLMPVLLIVSLVFLYYVLSTVEPEKIEYKITTKGIKIAGKRTEWQYLTRFFFSKRLDSDLMVVETVSIPGRIELVINSEVRETLKREVSAYIPYEEVSATGLDRFTDWFAQKLPGNK